MIKKINILLCIIAIIGGLFIAFTKDDSLVLILKDSSIIFTITGIYIIEKIFKIKINEYIKFIYILFIFMAHFVGVTLEVYNHVYWFDKFTHFVSVIATSLLAILILLKEKNNNKLLFNVLFILSFSMLIASSWEVFEFLASYYFKVDPQRVALTGVTDTMGDIIVALLGSILVSISYYFEHKENYNLIIRSFEKVSQIK